MPPTDEPAACDWLRLVNPPPRLSPKSVILEHLVDKYDSHDHYDEYDEYGVDGYDKYDM